MARNEQLIRQHRVLQILERLRFGATLDDLRASLIEELGLTDIHTRTVRRDLEALQAAGMDIVTEETQRGRVWKMRRVDIGLHKVPISASEMISLSMGRDLMVPLIGTIFWTGIESFWNKIREQLPSGVWDHYERYRKTLRVIGVPSKSYEKQQGMLRTINRAIAEHKRLLIEYEALGKPIRERKIEPYGLAIYESSIYVAAIEAGRLTDDVEDPNQLLRNWKLDRFHKATALDEWFKPHEAVDLAHLEQSIGIFSGDRAERYVVRLDSRSARWLAEDPWHAEQTIEPESGDSFRLTVPAYHPMEVIPRVLQLGEHAELLEPIKAREIIAELVGALAEKYRTL